jgi:hypothetical protein
LNGSKFSQFLISNNQSSRADFEPINQLFIIFLSLAMLMQKYYLNNHPNLYWQAQVVSCQLLTMMAWVFTQVSPVGFVVDKWHWDRLFS